MGKLFCGQAAIRQTKIGQVVSIELDITDLSEILKEAKAGNSEAQIREWTDKAGVVHKVLKLEAVPMREPKQYSTHSLKLNTYVKSENTQPAAPAPAQVDKRNEYIHAEVIDDGGQLPF